MKQETINRYVRIIKDVFSAVMALFLVYTVAVGFVVVRAYRQGLEPNILDIGSNLISACFVTFVVFSFLFIVNDIFS